MRSCCSVPLNANYVMLKGRSVPVCRLLWVSTVAGFHCWRLLAHEYIHMYTDVVEIHCYVVYSDSEIFIVNSNSELLRYGLLEVLLWYLFCLHSLSDCVSSSSIWNTSPRNGYSVPSWLESLEGYIHTYVFESQHWKIEPYIAFTFMRSGVCQKFKNVAWASH